MINILMRAGRTPFESIDPITVIDKNLIGNNSGNIIYAQSVYKTLSYPEINIDVNRYKVKIEDADTINEKYDAFVMPFANAFRSTFEKQLKFILSLLKN